LLQLLKSKKEATTSISRRNFTKLSATALASLPLFAFDFRLLKSASTPNDSLKICLFSKHLQFLNYNEMSEAAADMGFYGLDLTVRPKGHVLPEKAEDDLPKAVEAMTKYGLQPLMMTTEVWHTNDVVQKLVLKTASQQGIRFYRTAWLTYPSNQSITESQIIYGQQAAKLEILNRKLGLIGCYQNHAGTHVGAPIWDLPPILERTQNEHIGCQYDIRHAVVEGGNSWELGLRLIKPFIKSVVIKDFKWGKVDGKWKPINVPLGMGMVDFNRYFSLLKKYQLNVPISLHLEYDLGGAEHGASKVKMDKKEIFAHMKRDLAFIKRTWLAAE